MTNATLVTGAAAEPHRQDGHDPVQSHPGEGMPGGNTSRMEPADAHTCEPAKPYGTMASTVRNPDQGATGALPVGAPVGALVGGQPSNTPPQNSKWERSAGGEDWLEWSACVDWGEAWANLRPRLERAKIEAQDERTARETGWDMLTFGDWTFSVSPEGVRAGVYFAFRLTGPGVVLLLRDRNGPTGDKPNAVVRSDGSACLHWGGLGCLERGRQALAAMGGMVGRERLSRVDMALDLPGVGMDEFATAFQDRRYITQAKGRGMHESTGITVYLGKAPLMLRIYDKAAEMKRGADPMKMALMLFRRWQGTVPEEAIRVEFQVGRQALKDRGIDTAADYFAKRADLAAYLCGEWVRFTAGTVDRTNTTRMAVLPLWQAVADGFKTWTGEPAGLPLTPLDRGLVDVRQLERQGAGVLLTAAVLSSKAPTAEEFPAYCRHVVACFVAGVNWKREVAKRMATS